MKNTLFVSLLAIVLSIGFIGCEGRNEDAGKNESKGAMSNSDLEKRITDILASDDQLRAANLSVAVNADRKEATLSGTVESEELHTKAVELAKAAQPGLTVNDVIEVKPPQIARQNYTEDLAKKEWEKAKQAGDNVGKRVEDAWLHGKILAKLIGDEKTPARKINIDVIDGVVTLRGTVETADEKAEAQRLTQETEGVKKVDNQLRVSA
jgi:hyperosmotically inducible periplasmic protein